MSTRTAPMSQGHAQDLPVKRRVPAWRWVAVAVALPIAGLIGWLISGPVDALQAALVGGALTGAGFGAVQWWAAEGALGPPTAWIGCSAVGYACGLAAGAALVGYDTDLGALAAMGLLSGAALGLAQGLAVARHGDIRLAVAWGAAMPLLLALGWSATSVTGISVEDQFTVFGAAGAVVFTLLSGVVLAYFAAPTLRHAGRSGRRNPPKEMP